MTDTERKLLTAALGECWHENSSNIYHPMACSCGWEVNERCSDEVLYNHIKEYNRTFASAQDYEDLLVKVVRPHHNIFVAYVWKGQVDSSGGVHDAFGWFLTLSIEERCKLVYDFCIYMYKQDYADFRWVKEFIIEAGLDAVKKTAEKFPQESTQIVSGKGMPWEGKN